MTADLTREQAREQVARAIHDVQCAGRCEWGGAVDPWHPMRLRTADAALDVLWPVVEGLRAEARANAAEVLRNAGRAINPTQHEMLIHTFDRESYRSGQIGARYDAWDYLFSLAQLIEYGHENGEHIDALRFSVKDAQDEAIERLTAENASLTAELAHAHAVIARHVEPRRGAGFDRSCCAKCEGKYLDAEAERQGLPSVRSMRFMVVCSACGSKRCPRAADHDLACEAGPRGEGDL